LKKVSGGKVRQKMVVKTGIEVELAKEIIRLIKKIEVQSAG
jgi:uncharacterized protein YajQ (UPF0234 family)